MEKEILIVECDCGAYEEFTEDKGPTKFEKTEHGDITCPFCEEWSPQPPEGYVRPVFNPQGGRAPKPPVEKGESVSIIKEDTKWFS